MTKAELRATAVIWEIWYITWQARYDSTLCPPNIFDYMVGGS